MTRSILIGPPGTGKTSSIISRIETYLVGGGLGSRKSEQFFENLKRFSPTLSPVNEVDDLVLSRTQLVVRAANALHGSVRHRIEWNELYQSGVIGRAHQGGKEVQPRPRHPIRRVCLPEDPAGHHRFDPKSPGPQPRGP